MRFEIQRREWMLKAKCRGKSGETIEETKKRVSLFYPARGASIRPARAFCSACEVKAECLDFSFSCKEGAGEKVGIWGELSERQRRPLRTQWKLDHDIPVNYSGSEKQKDYTEEEMDEYYDDY